MKMNKRLLLGMALLGLLLLSAGPGRAAAPVARKVLIVDLPRLDLMEIGPELPHLYQLIFGGATGLLSNALPNPLTPDEVYLAFNSGARVKIPNDAYRMADAAELEAGRPAGTVYRSFTGWPVRESNIVNLDIQLLLQREEFDGNLGRFGRILRQHRIRTVALGNADADLPHRPAAAMIMDETGKVGQGAIGAATLLADPAFPYGVRSDPDKLLALWRGYHAQPGSSLILLTLGDLDRLQRFAAYLSEARLSQLRQAALRTYDRLLGAILAELDTRSEMVMLFSTEPPERQEVGNDRLSPVVIAGPDFTGGILNSSSTRRPGLVAIEDLSVTVLRFLGISGRVGFSGKRLESAPGDWRQLGDRRERLVHNYSVRWPLLTGYGYLLIGICLAGLLMLIFNQGKQLPFISWLFLFCLTIPGVFLLEALWDPLDWSGIIGWTAALMIAIFGGVFIWARRDLWRILSGICAFTLVLMVLDGLSNGILELRSFLGYSAIAGARYYGIGNEYMGFFLGAYIAAISVNLAYFSKYRAKILWGMVFIITLLFAHPNFGSDIGGGVTALLGLGITTYFWLEKPVKLRELGLLGLGMLLVLLIVGVWDLTLNKRSMTHFGQLLLFIKLDGWRVLGDIVGRKLALNYALICASPWSFVLLALLGSGPLLYKYRPPAVAALFQKYPGPLKGWVGLSWTALFALMFNDSGIVSAATMMIFGVALLLPLVCSEMAGRRTRQSVTEERTIS